MVFSYSCASPYFADKDALVLEPGRRHFGQLEEVAAAVLTRPLPRQRAGMREVLAELLRSIMAVHRVNPYLSQVFQVHVPRVGEFRIIDEFDDRLEALTAARLAELGDELRPSSIRLASRIVVRAVGGVMQGLLRRHHDSELTTELETELVELVLRYLLRNPVHDSSPDLSHDPTRAPGRAG